MSELIVAGYEDVHTAFLASAALARMQKEFAMNRHDMAVVALEEGGEVSVREAVTVTEGEALHKTFWKTLAGLLFSNPSLDDAKEADVSIARLSAMGLDDRFIAGVADKVKPGTAAVLVVANEPATRDRVIGILRGFSGRITRARLTCEDSKQCLGKLLGQEPEN